MALQSSLDPTSTFLTDKPLLDNRQYKVVSLQNNLEVLLIHDPDTDKASASLDVHVGSFADPQDLNGLAHFCEHLLFMGTEKYPKENEYRQYLSAHSGSSNAYTAAENTNFYFDVGHQHLFGALDRFAQFFIKPLFSPSCKDRELQAVDSENKKNLQNDMWRLHQLEKSLSNPNHPVSKFCTGNLYTLQTEPLSRNVDVRERLLEFYYSHYSANIMKLCVLGREPIDLLHQWCLDLFSPIGNINLPIQIRYKNPPYTPKELKTIVKVHPVKDIKRLTLRFPIPDQDPYYESKPTRYISHCVGHEGKGSLFHILKEKGWADKLSAGSNNISTGYENFQIEVELTPLGLDHYKQVLVLIFQYLKLLAQSPVQKWIFQELQTIAQVNFLYQQKRGASSTSSGISSHMQLPIPRERLLSSSLLRIFNPKLISSTLSYLTPDNFRATLVSQSLDGLNQRERWYGTAYSVDKLCPDFLEQLYNVELHPELYLPPKNEFIPENLYVHKKNANESPLKHPILLSDTNQMRLWYKKDDTFWTPKALVRIYLRTPVSYSDPSNYVKTLLLMNLFEDMLLPFAYDAKIAGLTYSATTTRDGIDLNAGGYNDKLIVLIEHILHSLKSFELDAARFEVWKERNLRSYKNLGYNVPFTQVGTHMNYLLNECTWTPEEEEHALNQVTFQDLIYFAPLLLRQTTAEIMAFGNLTKQEALTISDLTIDILKPLPLSQSQTVRLRSYLLPVGCEFLHNVELQDSQNVNSCVEYFLQVGKLTNDRLRVTLELFASMAAEPAFNQLRTREQLGYVVFSGLRYTRTTFGYRVLIQSERDTEYLKKRIDQFLIDMREVLSSGVRDERNLSDIHKSSENKFQRHVSSLIAKKQEKFQNTSEEAHFYYGELSSGYYHFLANELDIEILKTLTIQEVLDLYDEFISPFSKTSRSCLILNLNAQKKSSLQQPSDVDKNHVIDLSLSNEQDETEVTEHSHRHYHPIVSGINALNQICSTDKTGVPIKNIAVFKSSLSLTEAPIPVVDISTYAEQGSKL